MNETIEYEFAVSNGSTIIGQPGTLKQARAELVKQQESARRAGDNPHIYYLVNRRCMPWKEFHE